jgi:precorrin-4/cobalt-precorrin-4 C11-methyltransferase
MCIFLGVNMIEKVVSELREHYPADTPVAVVKRASWPDQEVVRGTLKDIAPRVEEAGIKKTALILVGEALGGDEVVPSKLYQAGFSHEYRDQ